MLLSTDTGGDGMAIAVAPTKSNGSTGTIRAEGRREESGGGDDIAMTITLRKGAQSFLPQARQHPLLLVLRNIPATPKTRFHAVTTALSKGIVVPIAFHFVIESVGSVAAAILLLPKTVDLVPLLRKGYAECSASTTNAQVKK